PRSRGARCPLLDGNADTGRVVAAERTYGWRFPARVLSALSRLSEILPALGLGPLPQFEGRKFAPRGVRPVTIIAVSGLMREALIAAGPGIRTLVGAGNAVLLRRKLEQAIAEGAEGLISIGIAGGLAPSLRAGD